MVNVIIILLVAFFFESVSCYTNLEILNAGENLVTFSLGTSKKFITPNTMTNRLWIQITTSADACYSITNELGTFIVSGCYGEIIGFVSNDHSRFNVESHDSVGKETSITVLVSSYASASSSFGECESCLETKPDSHNMFYLIVSPCCDVFFGGKQIGTGWLDLALSTSSDLQLITKDKKFDVLLLKTVSLFDSYIPLSLNVSLDMTYPQKIMHITNITLSLRLDNVPYFYVISAFHALTGMLVDQRKLEKAEPFTLPYHVCREPMNVTIDLFYHSEFPILLYSQYVLIYDHLFCPSDKADCFCETGCSDNLDTNFDGNFGMRDPDCAPENILSRKERELTNLEQLNIYIPPSTQTAITTYSYDVSTAAHKMCQGLTVDVDIDYNLAINCKDVGAAIITIHSSPQWDIYRSNRRMRWEVDVNDLVSDIRSYSFAITEANVSVPTSHSFFLQHDLHFNLQLRVSSVATDPNGNVYPNQLTDDVCFLPPTETFSTPSQASLFVVSPVTVMSDCNQTVIFFDIWSTRTLPPPSLVHEHTSILFLRSHTQRSNSLVTSFMLIAPVNPQADAISFAFKYNSCNNIKINLDKYIKNGAYETMKKLAYDVITPSSKVASPKSQRYTCGNNAQSVSVRVLNKSPFYYSILVDDDEVGRGLSYDEHVHDIQMHSKPISQSYKPHVLSVVYDMEGLSDNPEAEQMLRNVCGMNPIELNILPHVPIGGSIKALPFTSQLNEDDKLCDGQINSEFTLTGDYGDINGFIHYYTSNDPNLGTKRLYTSVTAYLPHTRTTPILVHAFSSDGQTTGYQLDCVFEISTDKWFEQSFALTMPELVIEIAKSSFTANDLQIALPLQFIDSFSISNPDGEITTKLFNPAQRIHTFMNLDPDIYVISWNKTFMIDESGSLRPIVCTKRVVKEVMPISLDIFDYMTTGQTQTLCPYSASARGINRKYWEGRISDVAYRQLNTNETSSDISVYLWDINRAIRYQVTQHDNNKYQFELPRVGTYKPEVRSIGDSNGDDNHNNNNNNNNIFAVFDTFTLLDTPYSEDSFILNMKTPTCVYSNDGMIDIIYPDELKGQVVTRLKTCKSMLNESLYGCRDTKIVGNRIINVPYARELQLEFTVYHSCRIVKTFSLIPTTSEYPYIDSLAITPYCDGSYTVHGRLRDFYSGTSATTALTNNNHFETFWRIDGNIVSTNAVLVLDRALNYGSTITLTLESQGGACKVHSQHIWSERTPNTKVPAVKWKDMLPIYCPSESDGLLSIETANVDWISWEYRENDNAAFNNISKWNNKKTISNIPAGMYRVTVSNNVCNVTIAHTIVTKKDYYINEFIEYDTEGDKNTMSNVCWSEECMSRFDEYMRPEFAFFNPAMLEVADRIYLPSQSRNSYALVGVPSLHTVKIQMPIPEKYRKNIRKAFCDKKLLLQMLEKSSNEINFIQRDYDKLSRGRQDNNNNFDRIGISITPAYQNLACHNTPIEPVSVSVFERATKTLLRTVVITPVNDVIDLSIWGIDEYIIIKPKAFIESVSHHEWKSISQTLIINETYNDNNINISKVRIGNIKYYMVDCIHNADLEYFDCAETFLASIPELRQYSLEIFYNNGLCNEVIPIKPLFKFPVHAEQRYSQQQRLIDKREMPYGKVYLRDSSIDLAFLFLEDVDGVELVKNDGENIQYCNPVTTALSDWSQRCHFTLAADGTYHISYNDDTSRRRDSYTTFTIEQTTQELEVVTIVKKQPSTPTACDGIIQVTAYSGYPPFYMTIDGYEYGVLTSQDGVFTVYDICNDKLLLSVRDSVYGVNEWVTVMLSVSSSNSFAIDTLYTGVPFGCGASTLTPVTLSFKKNEAASKIASVDISEYNIPVVTCDDGRLQEALQTPSGQYTLQLAIGQWIIYACNAAANVVVSSLPDFGILNFTTRNEPLQTVVFNGNMCVPQINADPSIEQWNIPHIEVFNAVPPVIMYNTDIYRDVAVVNVMDGNTNNKLVVQVRGLPVGISDWWLSDLRECPTAITIVNQQIPAGICGSCNLSDTSCFGCDGVAWSRTTTDICGVCGGSEACLSDCEIDGSNKLITDRQIVAEISGCLELLGYNNAVVNLPATTKNTSITVAHVTLRNIDFPKGLTVPEGNELLIENSRLHDLTILNTTHTVILEGSVTGTMTVEHLPDCYNFTMNIRIRSTEMEGLRIEIKNHKGCTPLVRIRLRFIDIEQLTIHSDNNVDLIIGETNITKLFLSGSGVYDFQVTTYPASINTVYLNAEFSEYYLVAACRFLLKNTAVKRVMVNGNRVIHDADRQCLTDGQVVRDMIYKQDIPVDYDDFFDYYAFEDLNNGEVRNQVEQAPKASGSMLAMTIIVIVSTFGTIAVITWYCVIPRISRKKVRQ
jgi:hypothetical protein